MFQGVLVDETIEVLFQRTGDFRWSPGAGAIHQPLRALGGKAIDPFTQRRIGKVQRIGDGLEAVPCHDGAHRLGATEDPGFLSLLKICLR